MGGKIERSLAGDKGGGTVGRPRDGPDSLPGSLPRGTHPGAPRRLECRAVARE